MSWQIKKAADGKHKYIAISPDGRQIKFGAKNYSDFTKHKNEERKKKYIDRHKTREDWSDRYTRGFWSRWLLWNKPTIRESKEDITKRFGLKF